MVLEEHFNTQADELGDQKLLTLAVGQMSVENPQLRSYDKEMEEGLRE